MKEATAGEYSGLVVAALVLVIVLIAAFMCIQLFYLRNGSGAIADGADGFCGGGAGGLGEGFGGAGAGPGYDGTGYSPSYGANWRQNRYRCGYSCMGRLGCGLLGVPP